MAIMQKTKNLIHLEYILRLCYILGISHPQKKNRTFKVYAVTIQAVSLLGYIYSSYGKLSYFGNIGNFYVIRIIENVSDLALTMTSMMAFLQCVFLHPQTMRQIINSIEHFDRESGSYCQMLRGRFWFSLVLITITTVISPALNLWMWSRTESYFYYYYVKILQYPQHTAILFLWFWIVAEVYRRFKALNESLSSMISGHLQSPRIQSECCIIEMSKYDNSRTLKKISMLHNCLCDLVDDINRVFGGILLAHVVFAKACTIYKMSILIHFTILNSTVDGVPYNGDARFSFCFVTMDVLFSVLAMAAIGHMLKKEAHRTISVCYRFIDNSNDESQPETKALKKQLEHFIQKIANKKPTISAAGFFTVDLTMIGCVVSSITTYMIVAVQFLKDN